MKGKDVRRKIIEAGISFSEVARRVGESPQNLQTWLRADDFKSGKLEQIASAINKPLDYFTGEKESPPGEPEGDQYDKYDIYLDVIKRQGEALRALEKEIMMLISRLPK